jgi:asparagine synthase (glutamine-hydrolysing)
VCGICGVAGPHSDAIPLSEPVVRAMTGVITHRGPDDEGVRCAPGISFGMRRLSIIDVAGSQQPLANEDESVWTVFNGEIFNFPELRRGLAGRGHSLRTEGDTETIVHLYEEYGPRFASHLRGMFAIAVWDAPRRRLVLARDRMGVKPLYIAEGPFGLAFASEVKSLIAGGVIIPELDPVAAEIFLANGFLAGPYTLFKGVRKMAPASVLVYQDGAIREEFAYWSEFDDPPRREDIPGRDDRERLIEVLRRSVEARMVSDVPLGVMLSGGLDSSLITALMKQADRGPVRTFSIGFREDAGSNELSDARRVAAALGTEHHELETSAIDHPELLDEAIWHLEDPVADISTLGLMLLSHLASEHVTVALSGQGADELLGGYRKHQIALVANQMAKAPAPVRKAVLLASRRAEPGSTLARGLRAISTDDPVDRLLAMSRVFEPHDRARLLTREFRSADPEAAIRNVIAQHMPVPELSPLSQTLALDRRLDII